MKEVEENARSAAVMVIAATVYSRPADRTEGVDLCERGSPWMRHCLGRRRATLPFRPKSVRWQAPAESLGARPVGYRAGQASRAKQDVPRGLGALARGRVRQRLLRRPGPLRGALKSGPCRHYRFTRPCPAMFLDGSGTAAPAMLTSAVSLTVEYRRTTWCAPSRGADIYLQHTIAFVRTWHNWLFTVPIGVGSYINVS
jgi:hypothetical protein